MASDINKLSSPNSSFLILPSSLKDKPLSEMKIDELVQIIFHVLVATKPDPDYQFTVKKASEGSSGFFILVGVLNKGMADFRTVYIKSLLKNLTINERVCAEFMRCFAFDTPNIQIIPEKLPISSKIMHEQLRKKTNSEIKGDFVEGSTIFLMDQLPGITMAEMFKKIAMGVLSLDKESFNKMGKEIGRGVIYDLLIANPDRFVRFNLEGPGYLTEPNPNLGNVLLWIPQAENEFKKIALIDNSSSQLLSIKKEVSITDDHLDSVQGLFDEEEDDSKSKLSEDLGLASAPVSGAQKLEMEADGLKAMFKFLTKNLNLLEEHVKCGLIKEFKRISQSEHANVEFIDSIMAKVNEGFKQAISEISRLEINKLKT